MRVRARAPLRLGFAGGGTDVSPYADRYGGAVLNATIGMYAYCHIDTSISDLIRLESRDYGVVAQADVAPRLELDGRLDLLKCVYNRLRSQYDLPARGFRLVAHSDAPFGSGLGGSSTLVTATVAAFAEWWKLPLGEYDMARLAFEIEREDAGLKGGKQDQYAAAFGGVNFMEFYGDRVIVNPLRIRESVRRELETSLLLCFTGRSRESAHIIEDQMANVARGEGAPLEAMHRVREGAMQLKEALLLGDLGRFAELLDRAWQDKKAMADSISNQGIDELLEFARAHGARAGKVSGAGGGGFVMFVVDAMRRHDLRVALEGRGHKVLPVALEETGAIAWSSGND